MNDYPSKKQREQGNQFLPFFSKDNGDEPLIPVITLDDKTGDVLMLAFMNEEALSLTLTHKEAYYWSRSRKALWHKGETSGQIQKLISITVDCDQDALLMRVQPQGDGGCCHLGKKSCFHREIQPPTHDQSTSLEALELIFKG